MPNALFVYPKFPPSYWGFKYALGFVGKKSLIPPLGLLTISGMFPKYYALKVVDMNVEPLTDAHLEWADVALASTMIVQKDSLYEVKEYDSIHEDFRYVAHTALASFQKSVFKEYLDAELSAFKDAIATFAKAQTECLVNFKRMLTISLPAFVPNTSNSTMISSRTSRNPLTLLMISSSGI